MIRTIHLTLVMALLALPLGALAQGIVKEIPETGQVSHYDLELGELELNGAPYIVPVGTEGFDKVKMGSFVVVQFDRVGGGKIVTSIEVSKDED